MEMGPSRQDGGGVFRGFFVQELWCLLPIGGECGFLACADASATAGAFALIDGHFAIFQRECAMGAVLCADAATDAELLNDVGFAVAMHFHFAGP